jgi:hypothetical protein
VLAHGTIASDASWRGRFVGPSGYAVPSSPLVYIGFDGTVLRHLRELGTAPGRPSASALVAGMTADTTFTVVDPARRATWQAVAPGNISDTRIRLSHGTLRVSADVDGRRRRIVSTDGGRTWRVLGR